MSTATTASWQAPSAAPSDQPCRRCLHSRSPSPSLPGFRCLCSLSRGASRAGRRCWRPVAPSCWPAPWRVRHWWAGAAGGGPRARAGAVAGRSLVGRLDWLVPPLLRTLEYCSIAAVTASVAPQAMPLCYALLAALAFPHYDTFYRLRHRRVPPPDWLRLVGGGWEVRLLVVAVLAAGGLRDHRDARGARGSRA